MLGYLNASAADISYISSVDPISGFRYFTAGGRLAFTGGSSIMDLHTYLDQSGPLIFNRLCGDPRIVHHIAALFYHVF